MHKHTKIKIIHSAQINLIIWNGNSSGNNELLMNAFTYCAGRSCLFIYMSYLVLIFHKRAGEHKLCDMYERAYGDMACICICIHKRLSWSFICLYESNMPHIVCKLYSTHLQRKCIRPKQLHNKFSTNETGK